MFPPFFFFLFPSHTLLSFHNPIIAYRTLHPPFRCICSFPIIFSFLLDLLLGTAAALSVFVFRLFFFPSCFTLARCLQIFRVYNYLLMLSTTLSMLSCYVLAYIPQSCVHKYIHITYRSGCRHERDDKSPLRFLVIRDIRMVLLFPFHFIISWLNFQVIITFLPTC